MTTARAFAVAHNLDVPKVKRKFWPQWSTVVVNRGGSVEDVIQHIDRPNLELNRKHLEFYPDSAQFTVKAGEMFTTLEEFEKKIRECVEVWEFEGKTKNA